MNPLSFGIIIWLSAFQCIASSQLPREIRNLRANIPSKNAQVYEGEVDCLLVMVDYMFINEQIHDQEPEWRCIDEENNDDAYAIEGLTSDFIEQNNAKSGRTKLWISRAKKIKGNAFGGRNKLHVRKNSSFRFKHNKSEGDRDQRKLVQNEGTSTVLVVRVTDQNGDTPSKSAAELSDDIFGTSGDVLNLRSGYLDCSGDKLDFVPGTGTNVVNGVVEITIPYVVSGQTSSTVESWVNTIAPNTVGPLTQWTHVMYILPQSVSFGGAAAYAYINWYRSVYWNTYSSVHLVLMHEIGHNLGHLHSGEGTLPYGDGTCMMGAHVYADEAPKSCFNGAKSWYFGWYSDRHTTVNPSVSSWEGKLVGIDDYLEGQIVSSSVDHFVIAKIDNLFLMYNRKEGVNSQVPEQGNMVTIVEQPGDTQQSWLLGGINESTAEFRSSNWNGSGNDLVIEVCELVVGTPDYARIIVYIDGINNISCSVSTLEPSTSPTRFPTQLPTSTPSRAPTNEPTDNPSPSPSLEPTPLLTVSPTALPSQGPTTKPSDEPTGAPVTSSPTLNPTASPTVSPIASPTIGPSTSPTDKPSTSPTHEPTTSPSEEPTTKPSDIPTEAPVTSYPTTSPTSNPTASPTVSPPALPTHEPSASPTDVPTISPTDEPTASPTDEPTTSPSQEPTADSSDAPTGAPTLPSLDPTAAPSALPTFAPSKSLTSKPTSSPSQQPTTGSSEAPTVEPVTSSPTLNPTASPTFSPSIFPTDEPTVSPSDKPTTPPSLEPTAYPSYTPTAAPITSSPTLSPTSKPTISPTVSPSTIPTYKPTASPTDELTVSPSQEPTSKPSDAPTRAPDTSSPTLNPSTLPTVSPSALPSISPTETKIECEEKKWKKFLFYIKNIGKYKKKAIKRTCIWLQKQPQWKKNQICSSQLSLYGYRPAAVVCDITCGNCIP